MGNQGTRRTLHARFCSIKPEKETIGAIQTQAADIRERICAKAVADDLTIRSTPNAGSSWAVLHDNAVHRLGNAGSLLLNDLLDGLRPRNGDRVRGYCAARSISSRPQHARPNPMMEPEDDRHVPRAVKIRACFLPPGTRCTTLSLHCRLGGTEWAGNVKVQHIAGVHGGPVTLRSTANIMVYDD
jgi:hypothetical protein